MSFLPLRLSLEFSLKGKKNNERKEKTGDSPPPPTYHGPDLERDPADVGHVLQRLGVLVELRVGDLARLPGALVLGVVDHRCRPLALEGGVGLGRARPGPAAGGLASRALGVGHRGGLPGAVLLLVPVLGLRRLGVGHRRGLVVEPALGLDGIVVVDLARRVLVPVGGLRRLRVGDPLDLDPVLGLLVLGVVDLLGRRERRVKERGVQQGPRLARLAVDQEVERRVGRAQDQGVHVRELVPAVALDERRGHQVALGDRAVGLRVLDDQVDLVRRAALVGAEHDRERRRVDEVLGLEARVYVGEELSVGTCDARTVLVRGRGRRRRGGGEKARAREI